MDYLVIGTGPAGMQPRHYRRRVATHHVTENLENDRTSQEVHRLPLQGFIGHQLAGEQTAAAVRA
jgi:hypothetical protein